MAKNENNLNCVFGVKKNKPTREFKFTLEDVLLLIDYNRESDDRIIISEDGDEDRWLVAPINNSLIWTRENLERKVSSICIYDDKLQIWLVEKDRLD